MIKKFLYNLFNKLSNQAIDFQHKQKLLKYNLPLSVAVNNSELIGENISIGAFTYINPYSIISSGKESKVQIGSHCAIGRFVSITAKGHSFTLPTTDESHEFHEHLEKDIIIGDYVWIGDHVFVKHGVTIGDHAIIGAHSVILKDIEAFEVVAGVPAKHIRFNTDHYRYDKN